MRLDLGQDLFYFSLKEEKRFDPNFNYKDARAAIEKSANF